MAYLEEVLPEFRNGAKIRRKHWVKDAYIESDENRILYHHVSDYGINISTDDWEIYQEPIDWDYIIKNKCLCRFWDKNESEKFFGCLAIIEDESYMPFLLFGGDYFKNCRPVNRDEVTFYEDKEHENAD